MRILRNVLDRIVYAGQWVVTIHQNSEIIRLSKDIPYFASCLRESFHKGHQLEAAHSLKLQELQTSLRKLTALSNIRLETSLGRYCKRLGLSPECVQLSFKIAEPGWLRRVLALPVAQRLRFMMAETDDAQKYVVKR